MSTAELSPANVVGQPQRIAEGVWRLSLPMKAPPGHINSWLLEDGEHWLVVDCGTRAADTREHWRAFMGSDLYRRGISRIFLTHAHPDHLGSAAWLARETGAPVLMAAAERQAMEDLALPAAERDAEIRVWLQQWQASDRQIGFCQVFYQHFSQLCPLIGSPITLLAPGDSLEVNGETWQLHAGYGHTPCNLLLYQAQRRLLITGDQVLPDIVTNVSTWWRQDDNPLGAYLQSLAPLAALEVTLALPAHGDPFAEFAERLQELEAVHAQRLDLVMRAVAQGIQTTEELVSHLGGKSVQSPLYLLVAGQIYARLAHLRAQGLLHLKVDAHQWTLANPPA